MLIQKTTILLVNTAGCKTKAIHIPTFILRYWKYCLLAISTGIIFMILSLVMFIKYKLNSHYQSVYNEKLKHSEHTFKTADLNKAKNTFRSIRLEISRFNRFAKLRGLEGFIIQNEKKAEKSEVSEPEQYYAKQIVDFGKLINKIPLGKPHQGLQTSGFGYRQNPFGNLDIESHKGVDFRGNIGSVVRTTAWGKVIFAGPKGGYGNCIIIQHANNFETLYGHLSKINVKVGQYVQVGSIIGALGNTGRSTGPHLHYEIIQNGKRIDPKDYLTL